MPMNWPPVDRFPEEMSDAYIDERISQSPDVLTGLGKLPAIEAGEELRRAFESIVVPTAQMRFVLRNMTSKARAYARYAYSDEPSFLRRTYSGMQPPRDMRLTLLTSLAGAGKTVTLHAFQRLHQDVLVELQNHSALSLRAAWMLTAQNGISAKKLLLPHFRQDYDKRFLKFSSTEVSRECSTQGVAMLIGDEFQFISRSNGSALTANTIFQLTKIGPPVFIAANYSLLHSFMRRNQEDRQRFFSDILELRPESRNSSDWEAVVRGALSVALEFHHLLEDAAIHYKLHDLTFGIDRLLSNLLHRSYMAMRDRRGSHVTVEDIHEAYSSIHYAASRKEILQLEAGLLNTSTLPPDLYCPVSSTPCHEGNAVRGSPEGTRDEAHQAELEKSLNAKEIAAANSASKATKSPLKKPAKPTFSADSLINASHRFNKDK